MQVRVAFLLFAAITLNACSEPAAESAPLLRLGDVLGGDDTAGYLRADAPRAFAFPADHAPHPGFRNEWWYFTGNLAGADGRRFGYQLTFFNGAVRPLDGEGLGSAWDTPRAWMAHVALTDVDGGEHYALERFSRENPGLAGGDASHIWIEDWQIDIGRDGRPWHLRAFDAPTGVGLDLDLRELKQPVLQGRNGLSQKSAAPGNASYYYSLTRLATQGRMRIGGQDYAVEGLSWLDREWSTSALAEDQAGWNWFSLQFDDGQELMYYELVDSEGGAHPFSAGNWTDTNATQTFVTPAEVKLTPLREWKSPAGTSYVVAWELVYGDGRWRVEALLDDQWMNVSLPYWEGAVEVHDIATDSLVGRGYLEMVRP